jgi:hypothetical protein
MAQRVVGKVLTPTCCNANRAHAFVIAARTISQRSDGTGELFGLEWHATLLDVRGEKHITRVKRCPACGTPLSGVTLVEARL